MPNHRISTRWCLSLLVNLIIIIFHIGCCIGQAKVVKRKTTRQRNLRTEAIAGSYNIVQTNQNIAKLQSSAYASNVKEEDKQELLVEYGDSIYLKGIWDGVPIVVEKYKLLFFTVAKVGCTEWKKLFRRMEGYSNWDIINAELPYNPGANGLKYLSDYDRRTASRMMQDPTWTKAIIIRDPKERFVSAYFDKVVNHGEYIEKGCCNYNVTCLEDAQRSLDNFLQLARFCEDIHWKPLSKYIREEKYWQYINFVGNMDTIQEDAEQLLRNIGAWDEYGANGWGNDGTEAMFATKTRHATNAADKLRSILTPQLNNELNEFYAADYNNPVLNLTLVQLF